MSKYTVQEGADLKLDCDYDKVLLDLKYKDKKSGSVRNIFTKTSAQDTIRLITVESLLLPTSLKPNQIAKVFQRRLESDSQW